MYLVKVIFWKAQTSLILGRREYILELVPIKDTYEAMKKKHQQLYHQAQLEREYMCLFCRIESE